MSIYHKIAIKNICVLNICIRQLDKWSNRGKVLLDIDTYDFAGHLSDDTIIAFYKDGMYTIYYYYMHYEFEYDENGLITKRSKKIKGYERKIAVISFYFLKNKLPDDFEDFKIIIDDIEVSFIGMDYDFDEINKLLQKNEDLFEIRD